MQQFNKRLVCNKHRQTLELGFMRAGAAAAAGRAIRGLGRGGPLRWCSIVDLAVFCGVCGGVGGQRSELVSAASFPRTGAGSGARDRRAWLRELLLLRPVTRQAGCSRRCCRRRHSHPRAMPPPALAEPPAQRHAGHGILPGSNLQLLHSTAACGPAAGGHGTCSARRHCNGCHPGRLPLH